MTNAAPSTRAPARFGRYLLCDAIGGGGMATVHLGRALGAGGFSRLVAIKRLHRARAKDPRFANMLVDEARMVSRIRHPNVVPTLDVVAAGDELLLVMEYVPGVALSRLVWLAQTQDERIPLAVAARIVADVLAGLEAAHTAVSERGRPLGIVHRDVSPQNIICGVDGIARVVDFGIAKAEGKLAITREGEIKGKVPYMAPEQLRGAEVDRRADVYATGIVLWELVAGRRLFENGGDFAADVAAAQARVVPRASAYAEVPSAVEAVLMRALAASAGDRYESAAAMADALESAAHAATSKEVASFVNRLAATPLTELRHRVAEVEQLSAIASVAEGLSATTERTEAEHAPPFSTVPLPDATIADTFRGAPATEPVPTAPHVAPGPIAPTRVSAAPLPQRDASLPAPAPSARRGIVLVTAAVLLVATTVAVGIGLRAGVVRRLVGGGRPHASASDSGASGSERPGHGGRRRGGP